MEEKQSRRVSIKLRWGESLGRHCERELEAEGGRCGACGCLFSAVARSPELPPVGGCGQETRVRSRDHIAAP